MSSHTLPVLRRRNPVWSGKEALAVAEVPFSMSSDQCLLSLQY